MAAVPHVVIVGGGFGGVEAAKGLAGADVRVTLIDRRNHFLFQPLLYQVATAGLSPGDIAAPIRSILRRQDNATVLLGEVVSVDPERSVVSMDDHSELSYDYLILAAGTRHSYFGNHGWEEHAPGLKSVEDALEIRRRVLMAFERAERASSEATHDAELSFVVVGGGPTGVEMAGAIAEIAFKVMRRDFRRINPEHARVILLEGADRILQSYPTSLSRKAERQLRKLGVEVRTETLVEGVDAAGVDTSGGRIETRTIVWGAGNEGAPVGATLGAETDRAGRVVVESDLSISGHPGVFVIGDLAAARSGGKPVPGVAQGALQGGAHAADCVRADLAGRPRRAFRYRNKGELATIGRSSAVGVIKGVRLSGWIAWMAWWLVHIFFLISFRSRAIVLFSWSWSYLTFQRGARLITTAWRSAPSDSPH
ncbi:MAG: NAD(P)/FAD-dependent oxidoreductase [Acidimicrobiales bacterium]|nr:NAD(P)/FAD-dependent oxidoreductase [Acidimicrobiales bacterium]